MNPHGLLSCLPETMSSRSLSYPEVSCSGEKNSWRSRKVSSREEGILPPKENTLVRIIEKEIQGLASGLHGISILGSEESFFRCLSAIPSGLYTLIGKVGAKESKGQLIKLKVTFRVYFLSIF